MGSELSSAALSATSPRIDTQFVDPTTGRLRQGAYELLVRLWVRSGFAAGVSSDELALLINEGIANAVHSDPVTHEAMQAVDELRNELATTRAATRQLAAAVEELATEMASMRFEPSLLGRVQQIEDRLQ